ncbi:hypothetical protein WUBG_04697, partial [Wuchereria bancrofti]
MTSLTYSTKNCFLLENVEEFIISYILSEILQLSHSDLPLFTPTEIRQRRIETCPDASFLALLICAERVQRHVKLIPLSGRRFTGHNGLSTSEPITGNDSNYFKLLEADGDSLLVGA